jgi:hypothetical protein
MMMATYPTSMTSTISELEQARHYLAKCQQTLSETRAMQARIKETVDRLLLGLAIEDHTNALLAALSWVWDAQQRAGSMANLPDYRGYDDRGYFAIPFAPSGCQAPEYAPTR